MKSKHFLIQYLSPEAKAQQTSLSASKKLWDNLCDCCHKVIQQPVIGHNFLLDSCPDYCRDKPERGDQEAQTGQGQRGIYDER